ncbi:MAG TPA: cell envelope biogenesis protein OmpA, partial [Prevotellaceae bacterium]|nr:cell envelope biogenesis protein OmpA [Prevotellaceae bacterium]
MSSYAIAQTTDVPQKKYSVATNSFWSNWFITAGGSYNVFYSDQEVGEGFAKSPFKDFRRNWGFGIGLGKWFTPGIGLRTKFQGVWGKSVVSED